jgi:hypothetical protein
VSTPRLHRPGVTVRISSDEERGEPAHLHHDVVGWVLVTGRGILYTKHVDAVDAVWLAAGLRETAQMLEFYAEHGTWPQETP